jgi:hypothetical protein
MIILILDRRIAYRTAALKRHYTLQHMYEDVQVNTAPKFRKTQNLKSLTANIKRKSSAQVTYNALLYRFVMGKAYLGTKIGQFLL